MVFGYNETTAFLLGAIIVFFAKAYAVRRKYRKFPEKMPNPKTIKINWLTIIAAILAIVLIAIGLITRNDVYFLSGWSALLLINEGPKILSKFLKRTK